MNKSKQMNECSNSYQNGKQRRRGPRGGVAKPFPDRLFEMLTDVDKSGQSHIVSWQPHGRCFLVHKPKEFVAEVMPKYFNQTKLTSFQRQLNLYGFNRLTSGADRGGYYHELFLQGRGQLTKNMLRTRIKGASGKSAIDPTKEPNFYAMKPLLEREQEDNENKSITSSVSQTSSNLIKVETSLSSSRKEYPYKKYQDIPLLPPLSLPSEIITVNTSKSNSPTSRCNSPPALVTPPYSPRHTSTIIKESDVRGMQLAQRFDPLPIQQDSQLSFEGKTFYYLESSSLPLENDGKWDPNLNVPWLEADDMLIDTFSDQFLLGIEALTN